jgi:ABC-type antimicrobial peptide transport system permease subunit
MFTGRDFNDSDTLSSPLVAIVNQAYVKTFMGNTNVVGETFGIRQPGGKPTKIYRIIGVVGNTKYRDIREDYGPLIFVAENQDAAPDVDSTILIRSSETLFSLIPSLKNAAANNSPEIVAGFSLLRASIREHLGRERLMAALSGFYGALAITLSAIGLYGVMSYSVARRTGEIGIRITVGASKGRILVMIVREAFILLGLGLAFGMVFVIVAGRSVQSFLFGMKPTDPVTVFSAIAGMTLVALGASFLPAHRAASVDPMQALRSE